MASKNRSELTLGAFFIVAAAAFWLVGFLFGWNGSDTMFQRPGTALNGPKRP